MLHPHTEVRLISDRCGLGVVATHPIPAGTVVWTRCALDQTLPATRVRGLRGLYRRATQHYCFVDRRGDYVLCWDNARFVNHSCEPNCISPGGFELDLAVRDIAPGEQLTNHYAALNIDHRFACECGAPSCTGAVRPSDAGWRVAEWDALVAAALPQVELVDQPLWALVRGKRALLETARGEREALSAAAHLLGAGRPVLQGPRRVAPARRSA